MWHFICCWTNFYDGWSSIALKAHLFLSLFQTVLSEFPTSSMNHYCLWSAQILFGVGWSLSYFIIDDHCFLVKDTTLDCIVRLVNYVRKIDFLSRWKLRNCLILACWLICRYQHYIEWDYAGQDYWLNFRLICYHLC